MESGELHETFFTTKHQLSEAQKPWLRLTGKMPLTVTDFTV